MPPCSQGPPEHSSMSMRFVDYWPVRNEGRDDAMQLIGSKDKKKQKIVSEPEYCIGRKEGDLLYMSECVKYN